MRSTLVNSSILTIQDSKSLEHILIVPALKSIQFQNLPTRESTNAAYLSMVEDSGILGLIETSFSPEELFTRRKESTLVLFGDHSVHFSRFPIWLSILVILARNSNQAKKTILSLF